MTDRHSPVQVPGATEVTAVSAGQECTLFLTSDGTLWAMGDDSVGELGDGLTIAETSPVQVASGVAAISSGAFANASFYVTMDGSLWAVGKNQYGQLGDGTTTIDSAAPYAVATDVARVATNGLTTLFLTTAARSREWE